MHHVIFFISSAFFYIFTSNYIEQAITKDGEYRASIFYIGERTTVLRIISDVEDGRFVTHSYIESPAIREVAQFRSEGEFINVNRTGTYMIRYEIKELNKPDILSSNWLGLYMTMVGRTGRYQEDEIDLIYYNRGLTIFDLKRNNSIITWLKTH